jgi:nitroreductase
MEFQDVVRKRRMVRNFEDRPVPHDLVQLLLDNARRAPSAGYTQGWAFLVLEGRDQVARFWDTTFDNDRATFKWPGLFEAPLLIIPLSHKAAYVDRYAEPDKGWTDRDEARWPTPYWHVDTGFAAMAMMLTAVDVGLGSLFFGIFKVDEFKRAFGVPEEYHPIGALALGYPLPDEPSPSLKRGRRPQDDVVHRGQWGA